MNLSEMYDTDRLSELKHDSGLPQEYTTYYPTLVEYKQDNHPIFTDNENSNRKGECAKVMKVLGTDSQNNLVTILHSLRNERAWRVYKIPEPDYNVILPNNPIRVTFRPSPR